MPLSDTTGASPITVAIQSFEQQLAALQTILGNGQESAAIATAVTALQTTFRQLLLPLAPNHPDQTPIFTEMNRHLRLLAVDATFLRTARQAATQQQRQAQIDNRLQQLAGFAEALRTSVC
ncbi:MAG: heterocyst frequency control protein PatD [Cyanobacteria bacterium J06648_16]